MKSYSRLMACCLSLLLLFFFCACGDSNKTPAAAASDNTVQPTPFYYFCNFSKDGQFLYVGSYGDTPDPHIGIYSFNSSTGATTLVEEMTAEYYLTNFVHHPLLDVIYVTMNYTSIYAYTVNTTTGGLTFQSHTPMNVDVTESGGTIRSLALHPNGNFAYAVDYADDIVETFTVDGAGDLTYQTTTNAGNGPMHMTFDSSGEHLYIANYDGDDISVFNVDASTGVLSLAQSITAGGNTAPNYIAIDPSSDLLVSSNYEDNSASLFSINQNNGQLTFDSSIDTGNGPSSINFDPSTMTLYIGNYLFNSISLYRYATSPISANFIKNVGTITNYPNQVHMNPARTYLCSSSSGLIRQFQVLKITDSTGDLTPITNTGD